MSGPSEKGSFKAEIAQDVIDEALRSVERHQSLEVELAVEADSTPQEALEAAQEAAQDAAQEAPPPGLQAELAAARQELEALRAQLELSQAKGREMMERLRESHERALRSQADLENFRKRAQKEKEEVQKFGAERLLKDLLPVVDNLDRALDAASKTPDFDSFLKGVAMTRKSFEDALGRHGVKAFSARGQPFDPRLHEAVQQLESDAVPAGHVLHEVVRGFTLNERLVRPAMVVVARTPTASEPPASMNDGNASGGVE